MRERRKEKSKTQRAEEGHTTFLCSSLLPSSRTFISPSSFSLPSTISSSLHFSLSPLSFCPRLVPACWLLAFSFRYPSFCNFLLTCPARATFLLSLPFLSYLSFKKGIGKTARIRKGNKKIPGKSSPVPSHYLLDLSTCLCFLFS